MLIWSDQRPPARFGFSILLLQKKRREKDGYILYYCVQSSDRYDELIEFALETAIVSWFATHAIDFIGIAIFILKACIDYYYYYCKSASSCSRLVNFTTVERVQGSLSVFHSKFTGWASKQTEQHTHKKNCLLPTSTNKPIEMGIYFAVAIDSQTVYTRTCIINKYVSCLKWVRSGMNAIVWIWRQFPILNTA